MSAKKEYFICFRGDNGLGGAIGRNIFNTLEGAYNLPCYFSSGLDIKKCENYRENEISALQECKGIIYIFTDDFFSRIGDKDDEIRFELQTSFKNVNLKKYAVAHSSFNWKNVDFELLESVIGKEAADYLRRIDYISYYGERNYRYTEAELCRALDLDQKYLNSNERDKEQTLSYLRETLQNQREFSGSYHLNKITNKLFPPLSGLKRSIVNEAKNEIENISLFELITSNKTNDYIVLGDGGIGKTVLLMETCELLLKSNVPALYVPLRELNGKSIDDFIFWNAEEKKKTFFSFPYVVLLLDGFNEVPDNRKSAILGETCALAKTNGIQVLLTSRFDPRQFDIAFGGFDVIKLNALTKGQIDGYLSDCNVKIPQEGDLYDLLGYPLMLTLYTNALDYCETHSMHNALVWKENPKSAGDVIWNFLQTQLHKSIFEVKGEESKIFLYVFAIEYVLPYVGYYMAQKESFDITFSDLKDVISYRINRLKSLWAQNECPERISDLLLFYGETDISYDLQSVFSILTKELNLLNKSSVSTYAFFHQNFRDCLAAVHLINCISEDGENLKEWGAWQESHILKFVSELCDEKTYKKLLDGLRNKEFSDGENMSISNALSINYFWHGKDFRQFDFSGLDLSSYSLRDYDISFSRFDNAKISPITLLQRGHTDTISDIAYDKDRKIIYTASIDGSIISWELRTASFKQIFLGHAASVTSLFFINGKLCSSSKDGTIRMWNDDASSVVFKDFKKSIRFVKVTENKIYILFVDGDLTVCDKNFAVLKQFSNVLFFDNCGENTVLALKNELLIFSNQTLKKSVDVKPGVSCVCVSAFGNIAFIGNDDGEIYLLNLSSGEMSLAAKQKQGINKIVEINDKFIAVASKENEIVILDYYCKKEETVLKGHYRGVVSLLYVENTNLLVSGSIDNTIRIWDFVSGIMLKCIEGYTNWLNCIAYSKKKKLSLTASGDTSVRIWNAKKRVTEHIFRNHKDWVYTCDLSADGSIGASGSYDGIVNVWDIANRCLKFGIKLHNDDVKSVSISENDKLIATAGGDGVVNVIESSAGKTVFSDKLGSKAYKVVLSKNGQYIAVGCQDGSVCVYDITESKSVWKRVVLESGIRCIDVDKNFSKIVCVGQGSTIKVVNALTGKDEQTIDYTYNMKAVCIDEKGQTVVVGDLFGKVGAFSLKNKKMLYEKNVQRGEIRTIIYGEKNCVLVGGSDSNVYCLNAKNGKVAYVVKPCFLLNVNGCSFKNVKVTDKSLIEILKTNGAAV